MNKKIIILLLCFVVALATFLKSNHARTKGKAVMVYFNKTQKLNSLEVWAPYGYYELDWSIVVNNGKAQVGSKGMSHIGSFGSTRSRNNYYHNNQLSLEAINRTLQSMDTEQPYLIWVSNYSEQKKPTRGFLMLTKDPKLYNNDKKLIDLAKKAIVPAK